MRGKAEAFSCFQSQTRDAVSVLAPSTLTCPFPQHLRGASHCAGPEGIKEIFTTYLGWIYISLF